MIDFYNFLKAYKDLKQIWKNFKPAEVKKNIFHTLQKNKLILDTLLTSSIMWFPSWLLIESS